MDFYFGERGYFIVEGNWLRRTPSKLVQGSELEALIDCLRARFQHGD